MNKTQHIASTISQGEKRDWSGKRDSNSRPRPWQGRALPAELLSHVKEQLDDKNKLNFDKCVKKFNYLVFF